jgi:hypothetical protein
MVATNIENSVSDKVKQDILAAWKEGHGGSAERVHLLQGEEGLVLLIPKALYQAELDLHRTATGGGKVLNQYLRTLLHTVASEFIPMVEEITEQKIDDIVPLIDLRAGWALAFYRF